MAKHLSTTRQRAIGVLAIGVAVGLVCAAINVGAFPPGSHSRLGVAVATTHVMIDTPGTSIVDRRALPQDLKTLMDRAELLSRVMITPPVLEDIGRRTGVAPGQISGLVRVTTSAPLAFTEPGSERRASDILRSTKPYRLEVQVKPWTPILDIYSQAPSAAEAVGLADNAVVGLRDYLDRLARQQGVPQSELVVTRQLGAARGAAVNKRAPMEIGLLTFILGFALSSGALFGLMAVRRRARRTAQDADSAPAEEAPVEADARLDAWPRTTRVMPWMLAGFIALLWLLPFNVITLNASLPIDLNLDRLVLPFIVATWCLTMAVGGRAAPRLRMTWIHAAFGAFVVVAFVSVVLDARYLNQSLELDLSIKKLPLLVTYGFLFVIVASAVRRSEVRAFLTYTLGLSVICALGMLYEYRFKQDLFYDLSAKLLPGIFTVGQSRATALDHLGRRLVSGPAEEPLEAVTMLCMAFPIALVGFIHAGSTRSRMLHGLAACALLAATFSTDRKSALLAPIAIGLTVAYFRRRDLLRLAPLAMVAAVTVMLLSPGAVSSTIGQFTRSDRLSVPTVSDRTSDYDAVRPDVWTHIAFGRGWGSYNHDSYRILDSEVLMRLIETGVIGLLALLLVGLSVVVSARRTIGSDDEEMAPLALIGAAAAVGFLVLATLYDELSFPHGTYIFLYVAGLVAIVIEPRRRRAVPATARAPALAGRARRRRGPVAGRPVKHPVADGR